MAGRPSFLKRQKERERQEKQKEKAAKRAQKRIDRKSGVETGDGMEPIEGMEQTSPEPAEPTPE